MTDYHSSIYLYIPQHFSLSLMMSFGVLEADPSEFSLLSFSIAGRQMKNDDTSAVSIKSVPSSADKYEMQIIKCFIYYL
jgi:hypothetical protein